jgi:hypothetical protein
MCGVILNLEVNYWVKQRLFDVCISEPSTVVYQISNSNGIHIGPDVKMTFVQNSSSTKAQPPPKETKTTRG